MSNAKKGKRIEGMDCKEIFKLLKFSQFPINKISNISYETDILFSFISFKFWTVRMKIKHYNHSAIKHESCMTESYKKRINKR